MTFLLFSSQHTRCVYRLRWKVYALLPLQIGKTSIGICLSFCIEDDDDQFKNILILIVGRGIHKVMRTDRYCKIGIFLFMPDGLGFLSYTWMVLKTPAILCVKQYKSTAEPIYVRFHVNFPCKLEKMSISATLLFSLEKLCFRKWKYFSPVYRSKWKGPIHAVYKRK